MGGALCATALAPIEGGRAAAPNSRVSRRSVASSHGRAAMVSCPAFNGGRGRGRRLNRRGRTIAGARITTIAGPAVSLAASPALIAGISRYCVDGLSVGRRCPRVACSPRCRVVPDAVATGRSRGTTAEGRSDRPARHVAP